ncbi:MAG: ABC transporter permease [Anaerolineaceae bacterium]|nr:MAG: ABC transporter permease [Anaerolineaceae bacterium]
MTLRILFHMARADFFERARRYSFLVMLGLVVWLGYLSATGALVMSVPPYYVGETNSPWVGALMTVTVTMFLGWFGFYLVKGSVARDYETGVGQIIATTPLSRPLYALGKWLSNFAVLGVMVIILMLAGIAMNLVFGSAPLDLWALTAPLFFIALPCMAVVAALAVLFETIGWLRGGFGNVVYFFLFIMALVPGFETEPYQPLLDLTGFRLIGDRIAEAAKLVYPESESGFAFQIVTAATEVKYFLYNGIEWTADILLPRLAFVLIAIGLAVLAALFFDRFNTTKVLRGKKRLTSDPARASASEPAPLPNIHLTPLPATRRFRFGALYLAELKMLLKGHRWWWYVVSLGLVIAQLSAPSESASFTLAITWLWMILLLSGLGNRETLYNTREIVFSAPRPTLNQLPATWLAAFSITALVGSGAFLRHLLDGDMIRLLVWTSGALFIPSLALALGVLTSSRKPFEVIYVTWMYLILNAVPPLDFVGVTTEGPWQFYTLSAFALLALAAFVRHSQLTGWKFTK